MTSGTRPALFFLIPFLSGILTGGYTSIPILWIWVSVLICFISSILVRKRSKYLFYLLLHIAVFAGGMLRLEIATVPTVPHHFYDQSVSFTGKTVYQPERGTAWDACYAVGKVQLLSDPEQMVSAKFLLRFEELMPLRYGKQITLTGELRQPQTRRNPKGFDYRSYLARQNVSGIIDHKGLIHIGKQSGFPPLRWIETLRFKTEQIIDDTYSELQISTTNRNGLHAKLLKGMLLGKRGDVPSETLDIFRNSGTFHVLAVSGLHVGLIALLCYFGLSAYWRVPKRTVSLLTIIAVLIYACLVGFRPSVFRASLMVILFLLSNIIARDADIYNLLAVAALALLLLNPTAIMGCRFSAVVCCCSIHCLFCSENGKTATEVVGFH